MTTPIFIPFNFKPNSTGTSTSYSPSSGNWARIVVPEILEGDMSVDGTVIARQNAVNQNLTFTSSGQVQTVQLPDFGVWKCQLVRSQETSAGNTNLQYATYSNNSSGGGDNSGQYFEEPITLEDGGGASTGTSTHTGIFECLGGRYIRAQSSGSLSGTSIVYNFQAFCTHFTRVNYFWVNSDDTVTCSTTFHYEEYSPT